MSRAAKDPSLARETPSAAIYGCASTVLQDNERAFFREAQPLGFILFSRNCKDPDQVRALVENLRGCVSHADAPVLIDQEGGRVARLGPPHWRAAPAAALIGALVQQVPSDAVRAARLNARLIADELSTLGITVDCAPVLDLPTAGAHDIIGDRALGSDPHVVGLLGRAVCEGLLAGGVLPVLKHVPGHGRAGADSHEDLPVVTTPRSELDDSDFVPFRMLSDMPWAMTAHILYTGLDRERPASVSPRIVNDIIRGTIGFDGLLVSDDLSMQALSGELGDRAAAVLSAGCDIALHCNGEMDEMVAVADAVGAMTPSAMARLEKGEVLRRSEIVEFDRKAALRTLDALVKAA